jgi:hypothetical protein
MRLDPPSLRARRSGAGAPKTAYASGVMTTGQLKRPRWHNGGAIPRSLPGRCEPRASDVSEREAPWAACVPCAAAPALRHRPPAVACPPWSAAQTAAGPPGTAPRQARAGAGGRSPASARSAPPATGQGAGDGPRPRSPCAACACLPEHSGYCPRHCGQRGGSRHQPPALWLSKVRMRRGPAVLIPWSRARAPLAEGMGGQPASAATAWRWLH